MANEIFSDTSGFFALLVKADDRHAAADRILHDAQKRKRRFVTTDHVLDETATLVKARGYGYLLPAFFERLQTTHACRIEWTDPVRFDAAKAFFLKHVDQAWSFTDCVSFAVMREMEIQDSFTTDHHFRQAGFNPLLANG